jgi:hypothetical protein
MLLHVTPRPGEAIHFGMQQVSAQGGGQLSLGERRGNDSRSRKRFLM